MPSQNSGVVVDSSETLMVTNSVISDNGADGITVNDRAVLNVAKSFLAFNGINGVHFLINSSPPASIKMRRIRSSRSGRRTCSKRPA